MAYRRSICTRATLLARRLNPTFSYLPHNHHDDIQQPQPQPQPTQTQISDFISQTRSFSSSVGPSFVFGGHKGLGFGGYYGSCGAQFQRHMSTTSIGEGAAEKAEYLSDVSGVIADVPMEAAASSSQAADVVNEVAIAAADSAYPVAFLQHVIDAVHSFTGLNWWAAIAVTTLMIRSFTVPFLINQLKASSKLTLMRPRLEEIKDEMQAKGMDPEAVADGKRRMNELFKEYGVTPFTPIKGIFIQGPVFISFFFAISNMAEKVPSFKNGGAFWFTDLTTPDSMYILPVLTALTFLINVEFNMQEGLEGNPIAGTMKKFSRVVAFLTVPFTMSFPQAIFCYWITSNIFSFAYGSVLKIPGVKDALKIPVIPVPPPTDNKPQNSSSGLSFFESLKRTAAAAKTEAAVRVAADTTKTAGPKTPSSADLSKRLRNLERQAKQKKKNKKR